MFPIYCNKCFTQNDDKLSITFYMLKCKHIFCKTCLTTICSICNKKCVAIAVGKELPQDLAIYFGDPFKSLRQFEELSKFHYDQQTRLIQHLVNTQNQRRSRLEAEQNGLKEINIILRNKMETEKKKCNDLQKYVEYYENNGFGNRSQLPPRPDTPNSFGYLTDSGIDT